MMQIAFTGGGSGGHIYPGLAVAVYLRRQDFCRIFWIGSCTGLDRSIVEEGGIEFFGIPAGKFRRYFSLRNFLDVFKVLAGFFAARKILKREKPDLLFSKGGFVSVPPCLAAASLRIPLCTHESDLSPGLATRINTRFAQRIFTAYENTAVFLPPRYKDRIRLTGNPIRPEFRKADAARGRAFLGITEGERILLVLGGSQGAREINDLVRTCLAELTKPYIVVHQTGQNAAWDLAPSERYRPYPYFKGEMPQVLAASELVLGRSGAGTIWECAALGRPMVLIPLSGSGTRGDQVENARFFEKAGAAAVLSGEGVSPHALAETVLSIAQNEEKRAAMARASAKIGAQDGAASIVREMMALLEEKNNG
ncbi:MAG: undecaprenyldiphospho-muramoylpentapeptide beta-N-acetylglucosaminyltransferase [Spirochaetaceae bacterium]|jgi:UDP-N-acetylglucosamine--N-acetylmuramyl-(pentapeptide) pyrophosphoryl-undecaprenol N-acetylglucosamine transferase|nr:undecaprenyldiphospho-muramoylpentapeptide beta-N-acetylglucosaminyltransferase [Spirochaetaceae bacterium]